MKEIKLTKGMVALVDDADYESLVKHKWCANKIGRSYYAVRAEGPKVKRVFVYMHRQVIDAPNGMTVDHKDGDGLNNQRDNIRLCTHRENVSGQKKQLGRSSQYKGVCFDKRGNKWISYIKCHQKPISLGRYKEEINAAMAYDNAAKQYFGEFARTNL